ncbi:MAG: hypothetical protein ACHQVK_00690, partial [Candidatus Paceibacterales bacterium]
VIHHSLPYVDDLTFTAFGKPWVAHSWGAGLIFYFVYSLFGPNGIDVLFALFGALASLFLFLTLVYLKVDRKATLVFVWLAASIISLRWPTRPEVLGPLFLSMLVYFLTVQKKKLIFLPIFFWLWGII